MELFNNKDLFMYLLKSDIKEDLKYYLGWV